MRLEKNTTQLKLQGFCHYAASLVLWPETNIVSGEACFWFHCLLLTSSRINGLQSLETACYLSFIRIKFILIRPYRPVIGVESVDIINNMNGITYMIYITAKAPY